jgi:hypothetical protein
MMRDEKTPFGTAKTRVRLPSRSSTWLVFATAFTASLVTIGMPRSSNAQEYEDGEGRTKLSGSAEKKQRAVSMVVEPIFGTDVAPSSGWNELAVVIDNRENQAFKGRIENYAERYSSPAVGRVSTTVEVPAHGQTRLRFPVKIGPYGSGNVQLVLRDVLDEEVATRAVAATHTPPPTLVEWSPSHRIAVELRGQTLPVAGSKSASTRLRIGAPTLDSTSGEPILPSSPATYGDVDAMLLSSADLAHVKGPELAALAGWVLAGGTLAVVPTRPEDLRTEPLTRFLGGEARPGPVPRALYTLPGLGASTGDFADTVPGTRLDFHPDGNPFVPLLGRERSSHPILPIRGDGLLGGTPAPGSSSSPATSPFQEKFAGYQGGNLHEGRFGAVASYGLGEVHVLAFDPLSPTAGSDRWVLARILELSAMGYTRRGLRAMPASDMNENGVHDAVRRALDPNENFRGALGVSALLLVVYAILAGPVLHLRAQRRGKPLEPITKLPFLAAGTFALLVVVGLTAKGFHGRARHLTLVETGAGTTRAIGLSYRGFFASKAEQLTLRAHGPGAMLARLDVADSSIDTYRLDREGLALERMAALPWQTVVVLESGFLYELPGAISVRRLPDGQLKVKNGTSHALRDAVLGMGSHATYFDVIAPGAIVTENDGRKLGPGYRETATYATPVTHRLQGYLLRSALPGPEGERLAATWDLAETAAGGSDFWPDENPVLIAELDAPDRAKDDSGLSLESERVLVRVVGEGGDL